MKKNVFKYLFTIVFLIHSCANYNPHYGSQEPEQMYPTNKKIAHTFFVIGDAGNQFATHPLNNSTALKQNLQEANPNSTLIFLGDNIYPNGMPKADNIEREAAEKILKTQTDLATNFKGTTIFIPGNHDWYNNGVEGLKRQQKFVEQQLGKKTFLPKDGCAIETVNINADVVLIIVDSQWYLTNWDYEPTINNNCDIKTRAQFLEEFRSEIKKARGKTTLVAIHHPLFSSGKHGGQYSFKSNLTPLPILGNLKNLIRKTSGLSNADIQNKKYTELKNNLVAAAQQNDKVVFLSGHEHNLQYSVHDKLHQIISGSGSKTSETRNTEGNKFSYGIQGYAIVTVFDDGSSFVRFINSTNNKLVYQSSIFSADTKKQTNTFGNSFAAETQSTIYDKNETKKSGLYRFFWGKRYRDVYSLPITAKTVNLDTLFGGLKPVRKGGGNQSKALRLQTKNGKQYVIRALRKEASQYIQATLFKDQYVDGKFNNTGTEALVMDVFTGSYPYAPFIIPDLSEAVGIYHLNPKLFYIPKQEALGDFNDEFGNELYLLEEQASEGNVTIIDPNYTGNIISTQEVIEAIHTNQNKTVDEAAYIKSRLFDMLINDWDRHQDQWRWLEFKEKDQIIYKPLPRDRDQAFSKMSDGILLGAAVKLIPNAAILQKYSDDLVDVKGFNTEPFPLDIAFIRTANKSVWDKQVREIQTKLTNEVIDKAFQNSPTETNNQTLASIKQLLRARRNNLQQIANRYYKTLHKHVVLTATNKDDFIKIECQDSVTVSIFRKLKNNTKQLFIKKTYYPKLTKEIWIYGLDDADSFEVTGKSKKIKIRLCGGQNNDEYTIENGKNIYVYDSKSKKNSFNNLNNTTLKLQDNYDQNTYDYKKLHNTIYQITPTIGANPDDGLKIGLNNVYILNGFERNPFTTKQQLKSAYYFATNGYELNYNGEFANVIGKLNLVIQSNFQSANFSQNFFGYGNETKNEQALFGMNYNRVKVREFSLSPSLLWKGNGGSNLLFGVSYQSIAAQNTNDRFIENNNELSKTVFEDNNFLGLHTKYQFENYDNKAFATLGLKTSLEIGFKSNIDSNKKNFVYLIPEISMDHKLISSGKLVLASQIKSHIIFNPNFEFYQAASIGGNDGLRGFRNQRFAGQKSLFQNTDLRYTFNSIKTAIIPIRLGLYGGFDYGRVWIPNSSSEKWNNSYGGGFFINGAELLSTNLGVFHSIDGLRVAFSLGFRF